MTRQICTT